MRRIITITFAGVALACSLLTSPTALSDDETAEQANEPQKSEIRLKFMTDALTKFEFRREGEPEVTASVVPQPLLRWVNPHSSSKDGILSVYIAEGRPVALAQFGIYSPTSFIHEFHVVSEEAFELRRDGRVMWKTDDSNVSLVTLEDESPPAESKALRTAQMRAIAEQFALWDEHGWKVTERQPLRLLRQPVYRYTDAPKDVIDGAVFAFVLGNDPEAVLLLEAHDSDNGGPAWRYAFSPVTIYALEAKRNGITVWEAPERRVFGRGHRSQYVGPYSRDAADVSLEGTLPAAEN